jgi:hypothetical protein
VTGHEKIGEQKTNERKEKTIIRIAYMFSLNNCSLNEE